MSEPKNFFDDFLNEMVTANLQAQGDMSIIEFANRIIFNNDSDFQLYPTQKAILKAFYSESLTDEEQIILDEWVKEERSTWVPERKYISLVLEAGRRASKCNAASAIISTTKGDLTYGELHTRLSNNEKVGIYTYNLNNKIADSYITYDIKSELNKVEPVYKVTTQTGKTETTNNNHPYLTWRSGKKKPHWVKLKDLKKGDIIATSQCLPVFGSKSVKESELKVAALILTANFKNESQFTTRLSSSKTKEILSRYFSQHLYNIKNQTITFEDNVLKKFKDSLTEKYIGSLNKDCLIILLSYICNYSSSQKADWTSSCYFEIQLNKLLSCIQHQFLKLGITFTKLNDNYIFIHNTDSLQQFFDVIGWNIRGQEEELKVAYANSNHHPSVKLENQIASGMWMLVKKKEKRRPGDKALLKEWAEDNNHEEFYDLATNNINWETILSIEDLGTQQTIALEVADTHVIGSAIISHNSTMASIIALKEFYDLIIMDNPHKHYGMFTGSPIAILVMAQSQAQVKETIFAAIKGYAENSTFLQH